MFTLILSIKSWIVQYHFVSFTHNSFLCADIGIEIKQEKIDNHTAYVQFWYKQIKKNPEIIFSALNGAEEISEYIEVKGELQELLIESKKEIYTEFDEETNTYDLCV